jgi:hypothetical protein
MTLPRLRLARRDDLDDILGVPILFDMPVNTNVVFLWVA